MNDFVDFMYDMILESLCDYVESGELDIDEAEVISEAAYEELYYEEDEDKEDDEDEQEKKIKKRDKIKKALIAAGVTSGLAAGAYVTRAGLNRSKKEDRILDKINKKWDKENADPEQIKRYYDRLDKIADRKVLKRGIDKNGNQYKIERINLKKALQSQIKKDVGAIKRRFK